MIRPTHSARKFKITLIEIVHPQHTNLLTSGRGGVGLTSCRFGLGGFGGVTCLSKGRASPAMGFGRDSYRHGHKSEMHQLREFA